MKKCILFLAVMLALALALSVTALAEDAPADLVQTEPPTREATPTEPVGALHEAPVPTTEPVGATAESPVEQDAVIYPAEEPLAYIVSGECGDPNKNGGRNVTWSYDTETCTLTISGLVEVHNIHVRFFA